MDTNTLTHIHEHTHMHYTDVDTDDHSLMTYTRTNTHTHQHTHTHTDLPTYTHTHIHTHQHTHRPTHPHTQTHTPSPTFVASFLSHGREAAKSGRENFSARRILPNPTQNVPRPDGRMLSGKPGRLSAKMSVWPCFGPDKWYLQTEMLIERLSAQLIAF